MCNAAILFYVTQLLSCCLHFLCFADPQCLTVCAIFPYTHLRSKCRTSNSKWPPQGWLHKKTQQPNNQQQQQKKTPTHTHCLSFTLARHLTEQTQSPTKEGMKKELIYSTTQHYIAFKRAWRGARLSMVYFIPESPAAPPLSVFEYCIISTGRV